VALLPYIGELNSYSQFDFNLDCQIHHRGQTRRRVPALICPSDPVNGGPVEWKWRGDPKWGSFAEGGWGTTNYLGVSGVGGVVKARTVAECDEFTVRDGLQRMHAGLLFGNSSVRVADILDGLSNTMVFAERGVVGSWGKWGGGGDDFVCPFGILDTVLPGVLSIHGGGGLRPPEQSESDGYNIWSWHTAGVHLGLADGSVRFASYSLDRRVLAGLSTRNSGEVLEGF
jgi:hypothetical protein